MSYTNLLLSNLEKNYENVLKRWPLMGSHSDYPRIFGVSMQKENAFFDAVGILQLHLTDPKNWLKLKKPEMQSCLLLSEY